jgi:hypothetical protein
MITPFTKWLKPFGIPPRVIAISMTATTSTAIQMMARLS